MKGLYISFEFDLNILNNSNGINKKVLHQFETFINRGYEMDFYNPYSKYLKTIKFRALRRLPFGEYAFPWNYDFDFLIFDFIYIRKPWFMTNDMLIFLKKVKNQNPRIKILLEVPTYPYDYEIQSISSYPLLFKDRIIRKKIYKYIDRIVTFSNDEKLFNIPCININNAILDTKNLSNNALKQLKEKNKLNIISVSSLAFWHGYDRAIKGLYNYYKNNTTKDIMLHIVGVGQEYFRLKKITNKYELNDVVIFHGEKSKEDLEDLYNQSQIGLDSLGRHRSKVYYNSSLKSKEYLSKGLVVVTSVDSELDNDFKYLIKIPNNESSVDFEYIKRVYRSWVSENTIASIKREIFTYSKKFVFSKTMIPIFEFLEKKEEK